MAHAQDCFTLQGEVSQERANFSFDKSASCVPFTRSIQITGLAISGTITKTGPDYLVRVVLTDTNGQEYLVMESYEEINSKASFSFSNHCEETASLPLCSPDSLKVFLKDATLKISTVHFSQQQRNVNEKANRKREQERSIAERINEYNRAHRRLWVADTTSLSHLDYAIRKRILGFADDQPTFGYEYYAAGVFEVGHKSLSRASKSSPYVESVDWRNRYGRNWMTPAKNQGWSSFCTAFATLGAAEALANLYYNQDLCIDLSEQEIASCADTVAHSYLQGIKQEVALNYLTNHGVCDEISFPFDYYNEYGTVPCMSGNITPQLTLISSGFHSIGHTENHVKHALIHDGPLVSGYSVYHNPDHAMTLVGYKTFHPGDTVYRYNYANSNQPLQLIQVLSPQDSAYIGRSYWIFKNSYAGGPNDYQNGYKYILFYDEYISYMAIMTYAIESPFMLTPAPQTGRIWEDKDGDGVFFWGIGSKPDTCPAWIPNEMDGDDDDPTRGALDQFGYATSYDGHNHGSSINTSETFNNDTIIGCNLHVFSCQLFVKRHLNMFGMPVINLNGNAELIVDGGCIYNAEINMSNISKIILRNGGTILTRRGKELNVPTGAQLIIEHGEIKNL